ncbi:hypothetical protein [Erythrobacter sp. R86502]|uniref:hypothetical protein n=1 Tax=Erythrobacter sp. R86502 TaxID=3093846 RepID=UPI0036D32293
MSDHKNPASVAGHPEGLAPETHNSEQDESGQQAQDLAREAQNDTNEKPGGTESRKAPSPGVDNVAGHETDLVDVMRNMEDTGEIDNSAFSGEPDHDDEPARYHDSGVDADEDEEALQDGTGPDVLRETDRP